jgi:type IV pilus assembly protein PilV
MIMLTNTNKMSKGLRSASGFTLMEVLVTVVILSVGLLGVAGLQLNSLRGNQSALDSSVAVTLAMEAADRIRANLPGVRNEDTGLATETHYDLITSAGADPGCISTLCSVAQIAQTDAFEWISSVEDLLPEGEGVICRDSTPNDGLNGTAHGCDGDPSTDIFAIKIWWDHDKDPATGLMAYRMSLIP